ncbi:MAG TPA: GFA family protein [Burkholderiales bacterium]
MIRGSCLCGSVHYEVRGPLGLAIHCHCSMCRKAHGAAFGTYARVQRSDFVLVSGAEDVTAYQSSPEVTRTFCRRCGSTLQFIRATRPNTFALALGTLDDDPGVRPSMHIHIETKVPWLDVDDDLPQHVGHP